VKSGGAYQRQPSVAAHSPDPDLRRVAEDVIGIETAGDSLVVLHTPPGEASAVGLALDRMAWGDVVGTIAGDDTIFIAAKDATAQRRLLKELKKLTVAPVR
jgi:transcriptional regulator of arginine metabolism